MNALRDGYFTLNDAAYFIEENAVHSASVYITPPTNANEDVTDEDSAGEEEDDIQRMSARQLLAEAEIRLPNEECGNVS
jgi:hypothetical protein